MMNPHCRMSGARPRTAPRFERILDHCSDSVDRLPYCKKGPGERFSTVQNGQRKLLLSEIELLCLTDPLCSYTVVYAGAAPGVHIPLLAKLFPSVTFHLYDTLPFSFEESPQLKIHKCLFTDSVASSYAATDNLVFVSDVRRSTEESGVWNDMLAQQRWHELMGPSLASLKFRLPWVQGEGEECVVQYLDGDVYLPVWGRTSTTECRLFVDRARHGGKRMYDCRVYEQEMSFFNRVARPSVHAREFSAKGVGYDGCYDCTAEVCILGEYLAGGFGLVDGVSDVGTLSQLISNKVGRCF